MELRDYVRILRARWRVIAACVLIAVCGSSAVSVTSTPIYESRTTVFVSINSGSTANGANRESAHDSALYSQQRAKSYLEVVRSTPVAQGVIDQLDLDMTAARLASQVSADVPPDTVLMRLSVSDPSPQRAQRIADALVEQLDQAVGRLEATGGNTTANVKVTQIEPATKPTSPVSPRPLFNLATGLLVGLLIGFALAVLLETLDTRIDSVEALQAIAELPTLGVISRDPEVTRNPLIVHAKSRSGRAEAFRQLRTSLQFVDVDRPPSCIVVTSAMEGEGKSVTAVNLAITLAQQGVRVCLIDADLRRPKVAEYLGIEGAWGLTDALIGRIELGDALRPWGDNSNFTVLTAGALPPNPSELLGSQMMKALLLELTTRATVIIDTPPLLPVTDAAVVAGQADGVVLVVSARRVRREQVRQAVHTLETVGVRILGTVLNLAPVKGPDAYRYGDNYGSEGRRRAGIKRKARRFGVRQPFAPVAPMETRRPADR